MIFFIETDNADDMKVISSNNWSITKIDDGRYALKIDDSYEHYLDKKQRDKLISYLRGSTDIKNVYIGNQTVSVDNGL